MSCNYAEGLSPYDDKGILGIPERFDGEDDVKKKCDLLVEMIESSKHVVLHTGAGISTSAGIPDFRGPNGVWTLEREGKKPCINISFNDAVPTKTHMAIKALIQKGYVHFVVSQNIDGLHLKSGLHRKYIAELHGNMFLEQCNKCRRQFIRKTAAPTVGQKPVGGTCKGGRNCRPCRGGILIDNVLDWEDDLPDRDLELALIHSTLADLNIALGTTLQIIPSGNLPLKNKKFGGKLVVCNLQPTKHDKKADLLISTYIDDIMVRVCKRFGIEIPDYNEAFDPTKIATENIEWTVSAVQVKHCNKLYDIKIKEHSKKRKSIGKDMKEDSKKSCIIKKDIKEEDFLDKFDIKQEEECCK